MDPVGASGECLMEYSIYDAIRSGFTKVVPVIREENEKSFTERIVRKWEKAIEIECVFQRVARLPSARPANGRRQKPWGTGHAIMAARNAVREPFAVINADDFYGQRTFEAMAGELAGFSTASTCYCLVAYRLGNTLSEHGFVSRGLCTVVEDRLSSITELVKIRRQQEQIVCSQNGRNRRIPKDAWVSMNCWGFTPRVFELLETEFEIFLKEQGADPSAEFFIAYPISKGMERNEIEIRILYTNEQWMGVTYRKDREMVVKRLHRLIADTSYPQKLGDPSEVR